MPRRVLLVTPTLPEYLFVTRQPDRVVSEYVANRLVFESTILKDAFPGLHSPRLYNDMTPGDPEAAFAVAPDVVFDWAFRAPYLSGLGLNVRCIQPVSSSADILRNARTYGEAAGADDRADDLWRRFYQPIFGLERSPRHTSIVVLYVETTGGFRRYRDPLRAEIFGRVGLTDVDASMRLPTVGSETLFVQDPDMIVLAPEGAYDAMTSAFDFLHEPRWSPLRAVRTGRVYSRPYGASWSFSGIVDTPLFVRWLRDLLDAPGPPSDLRRRLADTYAQTLGFRPTEDQIDEILAVSANRVSAGYSRMLRNAVRRDRP